MWRLSPDKDGDERLCGLNILSSYVEAAEAGLP